MCGRCDGFILGKADGKCYRRSGIHVAACRASSSYDLYMRVWPEPLPPLPPAAPAPLQPPLPPVIPPAPPLRPSPLSPPTLPKLEAINLRFTSGRPSNSLAAAGVLLHQFDGLEDWGNGRGYRPCHSGWCNGRYDHVSTSLINKHLPRIFNSAGGVILAPSTRWECSFPHDGGTQSSSIRAACSLRTAYAPSQLRQCMQNQMSMHSREYNEFVVSAKYWDDHLPDVVDAIMYVSDSTKARRAHAAFLHRYSRTSAQVPLVKYVRGTGFVMG